MGTTFSGTYTSGIVLTSGDNPATIASAASVGHTAAFGAAVHGPAGTNWTLTNLGSVADTAAAGIGISFAAAGTILNAGQISGYLTASGGVGISLAAGGTITNQSGGTISGYYGVDAQNATATVVNAYCIDTVQDKRNQTSALI